MVNPNMLICCLWPDMQKFPLRMKDNDLLVTELYHDPSNDAITALSVYLTPKTSQYEVPLLVKISCIPHFFLPSEGPVC